MSRWGAASVIAVLCGLLVACESDNRAALPARSPLASPEGRRTRLVTLVGTTSGPTDWRGEDSFEGADVAVHVLNRQLPRGERRFELVTLNDRGDPDRAAQLIAQAAHSDRTVGVVYAGPPRGLPAAEDALADAGIPALLCYGDLYGAKKLTPHTFQVSPSVVWEARRIASYLVNDRGYARIGVVTDQSLTGRVARGAMKDALAEYGRGVVAKVSYPEDGFVPARAVRRLRRRRVQAMVVSGTARAFAALGAKLRASGNGYRTLGAAITGSTGGRWRPQMIGFDQTIGPTSAPVGPGAVSADTYARGAYNLPVPSFVRFDEAFEKWWDQRPLGWELRAYEAVGAIGWAAAHGRPGTDLASVLERLRHRRFGGLDITFGPDDHTAVDAATVGLWTVRGRRNRVSAGDRLPSELPWVPLARGFSIDGERTTVLPRDWHFLFRNPPPRTAPAPRIGRMRFSVATQSSDPIR